MSPPQHIQWYSSAIEAYIYLPMVFTALPLLHFGLLKTKRLSNQVVQLAGFSLAVGLPLMYPCSDYFLHMVGAAASMVIMSLRMLEIGTIERSENSRWSLLDYTEFLMTSDNKRLRQLNELMHLKENMRRKELKLPPKIRKWRPQSVQRSEFTVSFLFSHVLRMGCTLAAYIISRAYFQKYGYQERYGFLSPFDFIGIREQILFACLVYTSLEFNCASAAFAATLLFDSPFFYAFNFPFLATSLRDWWSYRWNFVIKEIIHRLSFEPTLKLLALVNPPPVELQNTGTGKAIPTSHALIASLSAFLMSAALHELLIFMFLPGQGFGENTAFFLLQGIFCFGQIYLQRVTGFGKTWGKGVFGTLVGWSTTIGILVWMSPLFVGPYARSGVFVDDFAIPLPPALLQFIRTII